MKQAATRRCADQLQTMSGLLKVGSKTVKFRQTTGEAKSLEEIDLAIPARVAFGRSSWEPIIDGTAHGLEPTTVFYGSPKFNFEGRYDLRLHQAVEACPIG